MKLIIPTKFTKIINKKLAFLSNIDQRIEFKKLISKLNNNCELIFNFDGKYGQNKKDLMLNDDFLSMLPSYGFITFNFNDIGYCHLSKNYKWNWQGIKKFEINLNKVSMTDIIITHENSDLEKQVKNLADSCLFVGCENVIVNAKDTNLHFDCDSKNIKNIKLTSTGENGLINDFVWLTNLSNTKSIDLSGYENILKSNIKFLNVNKDCIWSFPDNINVKSIILQNTTSSTHWNAFDLEKTNNKSLIMTTNQLEQKFLNKNQAQKLNKIL